MWTPPRTCSGYRHWEERNHRAKTGRHFQLHRNTALFLHPAEAVHGDLGMLAKGDLVLALSSSGETEEILRLLPTLKRIGDALISFCCAMRSTLALASDVALDLSVEQEACGMGLAPTASTTVMLALGDALAIAVSLKRAFGRKTSPTCIRAANWAGNWPGSGS